MKFRILAGYFQLAVPAGPSDVCLKPNSRLRRMMSIYLGILVAHPYSPSLPCIQLLLESYGSFLPKFSPIHPYIIPIATTLGQTTEFQPCTFTSTPFKSTTHSSELSKTQSIQNSWVFQNYHFLLRNFWQDNLQSFRFYPSALSYTLSSSQNVLLSANTLPPT